MRKIFIAFMLLIAGISTFAQKQNVKSNEAYTVECTSISSNEHVLKFDINSYGIVDIEKNGSIYSTVVFNHGVNTFLKGFAELPMLSTTLQISNENDVKVITVSEDYEDIQLSNPMLPSRGTIYRNNDPSTVPYIIAPESIVDAFYPEQIVESTDPFIFRDIRGANIIVYPFRYNAVQNTLRVYKSISIAVIDDNTVTTNPLVSKADYIDPAMNDVYRSLFINYNPLKYANQIGEFGEMLVIYTSRDATVIQPYIDWKRQMGYKVSTLQVATGTNVKTNIQNAYSSNPNLLYVQLVGDWADIKSDLGTTQNAPMDPYMGCVAGSDFYPELIIGRFSASTTAQVTIQVNKAINYEKNPDMAGTWYKNGLGIASSEGSGSGDDGEADNTHMDYIKNNRLLAYTYTSVASQYQPNATASGVATSVNGGVSVINYCGHGSETTWVTSGYSNTNIGSSTNGSKLPFIFSVACVNGKFHMTTGDCFAEAWLKKDGGGAVVAIMSTINQPWQPPMRGQDYFNDILIGGYNYTTSPGTGTSTTVSDQRTTFGSITFNGNVLMLAEQPTNIDTQETLQTWTIFGDASLQVRTNTPKAITVTAGDVTGSPYSVTVTSSGTAVPNARVTLFQNGTSFTALTNSSGVASVTHSFSSGEAMLTVTAYNYGTYQAPKNVGSSGSVPSVPTGLTSSSITTSSASLAWTAVSGATSYDIQIRPQGGTYSTYNVSSNNYNASGLTANTVYEWSVRAKNSYGTSNYSTTVNFTTLANPSSLSLPVTENFNSSTMPTGWTTQNVGTSITERWSMSNTANAGGAAYEAKCAYQNVNPGTTRLITPPINTVGASQLNLSFKHQFDDYAAGATLRVQTSKDKVTWTNETWSLASASNTTTTATINTTVSNNLNSTTTYIAFVVDGNLYQIDNWYIDNISITAATAATVPTVTTTAASSITTSSATSGGNVTADGGATVTARGICYSTAQNPTTSNSTVASGSGTGTFTANITGLASSTTYYVRAYATNSAGTAYGTQISFTTLANPSSLSLPVTENFNSSTMPTGWTTQNVGTSITERWATSNTALAGGAAYEMKCTYQNVNPATTRLITPAINTLGVSQVTMSFRHMLDTYGTGVTLRVQTSNDKATWTNSSWSVATTSTNIAATTVTVNITTNLNSSTTYFALVADGNLYQIDYWYIDNVSLTAGTAATVPTVSTTAISSITSSSATGGGNVTADGGATVTARGICYSTSQNPTTSSSIVASGSGTGTFIANITGLAASTTYYVRAYATNSAGTAYGTQVSFTTSAGGTTSGVVVGTGTSTQGYPLNCYYGYERSAAIYTAAEIGKVGTISKLGWYPTLTTTTSVPVKIYIKHTTASTLTASTWATMISGATLVYNGTMSGTTANAWKEFVLSTAFEFTGGSNNLLVLVETNYGGAGTGTSTGAKFRYTSSTSRHMYVRADNSAPTGNGTVTSYRPNITITITTRGSVTEPEENNGIEEENNISLTSSELLVYPNPTKSIITLKGAETFTSIEVYSIIGKRVYVNNNLSESPIHEIDLTEFPNGVYLVIANDGESTHKVKVVKN
jgi:gingipain R